MADTLPAPIDSDDLAARVALGFDLVDEAGARLILGAGKPISRATLWRGMTEGRYPRPIKLGRKLLRWKASELAAAVERAIAARDREAAQCPPQPLTHA